MGSNNESLFLLCTLDNTIGLDCHYCDASVASSPGVIFSTASCITVEGDINALWANWEKNFIDIMERCIPQSTLPKNEESSVAFKTHSKERKFTRGQMHANMFESVYGQLLITHSVALITCSVG